MILTPMVIADAPTCATPNRAPYVVRFAPGAQPVATEARKYNVLVPVSVHLDASGNPTSVRIIQSSGLASVDQAALSMAQRSRYAPRIVDCVATAGKLVFDAQIPRILQAYFQIPRFEFIDHGHGGSSETPCTHEASVTNAVAPIVPRDVTTPVTALVTITIGTSGKVISARMQQGTGFADADREALRAARASTYASKQVNCKAVRGTYLFRAEFNPD